jgi:peptide chain release factor subunit 1
VDKHLIEFKKKLNELKGYRGRHTELVTVMVPEGFDIYKVSNQISQERGTATNIKSRKTRINVTTALEKIIQHLALFKKTPEHGLAVFCGNVGDERDDWVFESIIPPEPLSTRVYRCDQTFFLEPFKDMLQPKDVYGLLVVDRGGATLGILRGKRIDVVRSVKSIVFGKFKTGGQSAGRIERSREQMANDFYKEVAEAFIELLMETKGVIVGGPGPTKEEFIKVLPRNAAEKIIAIKDIGYSDEYGLRELMDKSQDTLAQTEAVHEKKVLAEFFKRIAKGEPVDYGKAGVRAAIESGAAETVLLSESLKTEVLDELADMAEKKDIPIEYISVDSPDGEQFLAMGGTGVLLRYQT